MVSHLTRRMFCKRFQLATSKPLRGICGSVSVVLTQSATPNAQGQFPLTGSLSFSGGGCSSTTAVSGTVSGVGVTLASAPGPVVGQKYVSVIATIDPAASQVIINGTLSQGSLTDVVFEPSPCSTVASSSSTYYGTLTLQ